MHTEEEEYEDHKSWREDMEFMQRKMKEENKIILYQDDNEITRVSVRFADEDLWLTQNQLADIYQTSKSNVSEHIKHIFEDGELDKTVVVRNFRITTQHGAMEGKTQSRDVAHYNLDMIIALGYRVQSQEATSFRRWATQRLHEYIQKGFAMDIELQRLNLLVSGFLDLLNLS